MLLTLLVYTKSANCASYNKQRESLRAMSFKLFSHVPRLVQNVYNFHHESDSWFSLMAQIFLPRLRLVVIGQRVNIIIGNPLQSMTQPSTLFVGFLKHCP
ncbi:hypothetical protein M0802_011608 [Mischocyttarus mexicanus]|nr:hypothetical protein M0802_011608 [Mischocyttarus mexicanus]